MIKVNIEIDEALLRKLVYAHLTSLLGMELDEKDIDIQVKSKQNFRSEWESAQFRAIVNKAVAT